MGLADYTPREQLAQAPATLGAFMDTVAITATKAGWGALRTRATLLRVLATRFATFPPHSRFTSASTRCDPRCTAVAETQPISDAS